MSTTDFKARDDIQKLAARLDEAEKRIGELELASPCPMLKSICEDWEYSGKLDGTERIKIPIGQPKFGPVLNDAKPQPDKEEMVERYIERVISWSRGKDTLRELLSDFYEEVKHGA